MSDSEPFDRVIYLQHIAVLTLIAMSTIQPNRTQENQGLGIMLKNEIILKKRTREEEYDAEYSSVTYCSKKHTRNAYACKMHKRKHQKCPGDCGNRKSNL